MTELDPEMSLEWAALEANVLEHDHFQNDWIRLFGRDGGQFIGAKQRPREIFTRKSTTQLFTGKQAFTENSGLRS